MYTLYAPNKRLHSNESGEAIVGVYLFCMRYLQVSICNIVANNIVYPMWLYADYHFSPWFASSHQSKWYIYVIESLSKRLQSVRKVLRIHILYPLSYKYIKYQLLNIYAKNSQYTKPINFNYQKCILYIQNVMRRYFKFKYSDTMFKRCTNRPMYLLNFEKNCFEDCQCFLPY